MLHIEPLKPEDLPALRTLFLQERQRTFHWLAVDTFMESDFDPETEGEEVLVAHLDNIVVGFISLWLPGNFIHHLYVGIAHQQSGIGSGLLQAAIHLLKAPVTLKCLVLNEQAIRFYYNHGFVVKGTGQSAQGDYILLSSTV
jgi:ribosomal protein S18 acetylase RimI-like enzyme